MTECHRVIDLAKVISGLTGVEIDHVENPCNEAESNDLFVENRQLLELGLRQITLEDGLPTRSPRSPASTRTGPTSTRSRAGRCGGPRSPRSD
jgi:hypothetical protein